MELVQSPRSSTAYDPVGRTRHARRRWQPSWVSFSGASRQVDTDLFPIPEYSEDSVADVGPIGQFAALWFYQEGDNSVSPLRSLNKVQESTTLRRQVNAWAADLFPGVEFNALPVSGTSQMRLEMKSDLTSHWMRPRTSGTGLPAAFPLC